MLDAKTARNARMLIDEGSRLLRGPGGSGIEGPCSLLRAIEQLVDNPHAGMSGARPTPELLASRVVTERLGRPPAPGTMFFDVARRDATVAGTGGYLVGDAVAPGRVFTSALRANSVSAALGVRELHVERVNAALPRVASDIQTYWLADEGTQITEGNLTFGTVATTPKTVGAYFEISDRLLKQMTPAGEAFVLAEAGKAVAAAMDAALINGSGVSGQPQGILGTAGVGSESGGSLTWAAVASAINDVEAANAMVNGASGGWAIAPDAAEIMRVRDKATAAGQFILANGQIDGRKAVVSNSVPSGVALFGAWDSVMIASWGALEIGVMRGDPGAVLFKAGIVGVRCLWTVDVFVLQPASFSKITSIS